MQEKEQWNFKMREREREKEREKGVLKNTAQSNLKSQGPGRGHAKVIHSPKKKKTRGKLTVSFTLHSSLPSVPLP